MSRKGMHFDKRQVFIVDNRKGDFYQVHDIILEMLQEWNAMGYSFDLDNEGDWQYAGNRLAIEMGATLAIITDDARDLIKVFDRSKRRGAK